MIWSKSWFSLGPERLGKDLVVEFHKSFPKIKTSSLYYLEFVEIVVVWNVK